MIQLLAEVTGKAETMIPGSWITTFVVAVIGAAAAAWMKISGRREGLKEATNNITLQNPVPEIPFRKVPGMVSWNDHSTLVERVARLETHIDQMRKEQADQFKDLLESGSVREERIMTKIDTVARDWHARMDSQFGPKPRGGAR